MPIRQGPHPASGSRSLLIFVRNVESRSIDEKSFGRTGRSQRLVDRDPSGCRSTAETRSRQNGNETWLFSKKLDGCCGCLSRKGMEQRFEDARADVLQLQVGCGHVECLGQQPPAPAKIGSGDYARFVCGFSCAIIDCIQLKKRERASSGLPD